VPHAEKVAEKQNSGVRSQNPEERQDSPNVGDSSFRSEIFIACELKALCSSVRSGIFRDYIPLLMELHNV
jgi:hypothetical protein